MSETTPAFGTRSDYDPLCMAVVGIADNLTLPPYNLALDHYNDEVIDALKALDGKATSIKQGRYEKTAEQLDSLAAQRGHGISPAPLYRGGKALP
jgi:hypothetical protein